MKTKLTLSVDEELVKFGKAYAARRGMSLSKFVENALEEVRARDGQTFSEKWGGQFVLRERPGDPRMAYLLERYK